MKLAHKFSAFTLIGVLAVAACGGDDGGPGLSETEKTALATTLANTGALGGFGAFAGFAVQTVGEVGKINAAVSAAVNRAMTEAIRLGVSGVAATTYDAVGFAIDYDYSAQGQTFSGWFIGVVGWNGINTSAGTVSELVVVGGGDEVGSLPGSASGNIVDGDVFALYWSNPNTFIGISGQGTISSSNFTGTSQDCSASQQGITVQCSVQTGRMNGNFDFVAEDFEGSAGTYTQAPVAFSNLPSVRIVISITQG